MNSINDFTNNGSGIMFVVIIPILIGIIFIAMLLGVFMCTAFNTTSEDTFMEEYSKDKRN